MALTAAAITVQITMARPADTWFRMGSQVNMQLRISASTTFTRMGFSVRAWGVTMAMNIP